MSITTAYKASFGQYNVSHKPKNGERLLLGLVIETSMDGVSGYCRAELSGAEFTPLKIGESVKVSLDSGAGMVTVFTGYVANTVNTASTQQILALDELSRLVGQPKPCTYEDVSLDHIIKDMLNKAGGKVGNVSKGYQVAAYVVHRTPALLVQLRHLAVSNGADLFCSGDGAIQVITPDQRGKSHSFEFAQNVLALQVGKRSMPFDSVEVWGEGAASAKGANRAHWLTTDITGICGKASVDAQGNVISGKLGSKPLQVRDGALRSGSAASAAAKARMQWLAARKFTGFMEVYGGANVMLGDTIKVDKLPPKHAATQLLVGGQALRVRCLRHTLNRQCGLITRLDF